MTDTPKHPAWMSHWLVAAAAYNLAWGAFVVLFPGALFSVMGLEQPLYPSIWQCVGMIIGVFGIGYAVASRDPLRHWPIVLVGLLGKIFGPIGFLWTAVNGELPWTFGLTIITNDLLWWIPFALILFYAVRNATEPTADEPTLSPADAMRTTTAHDGESVAAHSQRQPLLLVFLRHTGCTFCKEAMADLASRKDAIDTSGCRIALVHMNTDDEAAPVFASYGLEDAIRISDPSQRLYRAFELRRGSFTELFGLTVWVRGAKAALAGHGIGKLAGDGFQMPGAFVVKDAQIIDAFRHKTAADRPDYVSMSSCAIN